MFRLTSKLFTPNNPVIVHFRMEGYEKSLDHYARKVCLAADLAPGVTCRFRHPAHLPLRLEKWTILVLFKLFLFSR